MFQAVVGTILICALIEVSFRLSHRVAGILTPVDTERRSLLLLVWVVLSSGTVAVLTELLSLVHWLDTSHLFFAWLLICAAAWFLARNEKLPSIQFLRANEKTEKLLIWSIWAILAITGIVSLVSAPNNADSLGYHNARVMHWLAQKSVSHYFALDHRQLRMPPLASYLRLHAYALTGQDFLFNFNQRMAIIHKKVWNRYED